MKKTKKEISLETKYSNLLDAETKPRLEAVATAFVGRLKGVEISKPSDKSCLQALTLSAAGFTWEQVLCELGWSHDLFLEWKLNFTNIKQLDDACKLLFKAHLDSQLQEAITNPEINLRAIQLQMKHNSSYYNDDVIDVRSFSTMSTEQRVACVINLMGKGDVSISQTNRLLEALTKLEELGQLPLLGKQLEDLQAKIEN